MFLEKHAKTAGILFAGLVILSVVGLGVAYVFFAGGETEFHFNVFSDLPENMEGLRVVEDHPGYAGIQKDLSIVELDTPYTLILEVSAMKERGRHDYLVVIDSEDFGQAYEFSLNEGEVKRIEHAFTPTEDDKWSLDSIQKDEQAERYGISEDSFLGERITPGIIPQGEYRPFYDYSPIQFSVMGFGKILNMNMTLEELRRNPYVDENSVFKEDKLRKTNTTKTERMYVEDAELVLERTEHSTIHVSREKEVRIYLVKDGEPILEKTLGFKYQIQ
ncbi:MAG TPA: hypothetical protein ENN13_04960 [Candidatus Altiarchaeales archaeon]|nr:hypothetical protein [Candidatus Altiarchaeales archaeon]